MHRGFRITYIVLGFLLLGTAGCAEKLRSEISKDLTHEEWNLDVPSAKKDRKVTATFSGETEVTAIATVGDEKIGEQKEPSKEFTLTFTQPAGKEARVSVSARKPGKMTAKLSSD